MKFRLNVRSALYATVAALALAACSDVNSPASPGNTTPITITPLPPATGGGSAGGAAFARRATAPASQADCPTGLVFVTGVPVPNEVGNPAAGTTASNFCRLPRAGDIVPANLTGTRTIPFQADPILIDGSVFIGTATAPANITFAAGQRFITAGRPGVVDLLVVSRGSRVQMVGTATNPIILTSMQDFADNGLPDGSRPFVTAGGDWGGLAINGRAPLNECTVNTAAAPGTDACRQNGEGASGEFGGGDPADNSGHYEFVRVQHAGFSFTPTNELNSIALQGVGNGTIFRNVQVHRGADDGFEWFGGTVNGTNLVATGAADDSFDWTDGWIGRVQFGVAVTDTGADNGIEGDNNGDTVADALPRSTPILSNLTLVGTRTPGAEGIQVRAGTAGTIANTVVANFVEGLEFNPAGTGPNPTITSVVLEGNTADFAASGATLFNAGANNVRSASNTLNGVLPGVNARNATAVNPTTLFSGFTAANYVGAFAPTDSTANFWAAGWTVGLPGATTAGCPTGTSDITSTTPVSTFPGRSETRVCRINKPVAGNVRLTSGNLYEIDGSTFIGTDRGPNPAAPLATGVEATLTIDAGVTLYGRQVSGVVDLLVVSRGSRIEVNGSVVAPVIMTSRADLVNGGALRASATNEWGGLAVNGRAPLNECTVDPTAAPGSVNCQQTGEGASGQFGGATPNDNSGRIEYLQIRYGGFPFTSTNELNSIAFQGAGSGTITRFVQVINGGDDGIEWFGGTNSVRNAVVLGANDDAIDWTDGWNGVFQYGIVTQGGNVNVGDNGIEGDNNGDTIADATPRSNPVVANVTLIGDRSASDEGVQVRAGTYGAVVNVIVNNFGQALEFNPAGTGPNPIISGFALVDNVTNFAGSGQTLFNAGTNNITNANSTLTVPAGATRAFLPGANETAGGGGVNPVTVCTTVQGATGNNCANLDAAATFRGGVSGAGDRWWAGWTQGL